MRTPILATVLILCLAVPASAQLVEIRAFESAQIAGLTIGFEDVLSESRCPLDAVCIWEGDGVIQIAVESDAGEPASFELHTNWGFTRQVQYDGYTITMIDLRPYPLLRGVPAPEDYVATLLVTAGFVAKESTSWSAVKALY